ncbi:MAG: RNA methyltransferase [Pirellulales bacterium]
MPVEFLTSLDDPRLAPYRDLRQTNLTRWSGLFIAHGRRVVERLLASEYGVESVLLSDRRQEALFAAWPAHWVAQWIANVPVLVVGQDLAEQLVGYNFHAGVLACGRRFEPFTVAETLAVCRHSYTVVACPRITNPDNLASILRICAALGIDGVLLGPGSCDPFSRRVLRLSMGAAFGLPIAESTTLLDEVTAARDAAGWQLIAAAIDDTAEPLCDAARPQRIILVLGNEAAGLDEAWLAACDRRVMIPMTTAVDSLNVAVAAGVMLHHFVWMAQVVPSQFGAGPKAADS